MKNTIVTYIYPGAEKFIPQFIKEINKCTLVDFNIIFFNDNAKIVDVDFIDLKYPFKVIENIGTINEVRFNSFKILKAENPENIYFQDIDDLFSTNRFSILKEKLKKHDLVCNDLIVMTNDKLEKESFWEKRLGNNFEFDYRFIKDKNIVGLGNTAIKKHLLNTKTYFSNAPIAYDWFYFYQLLKLTNTKALFTSEAFTYYLQHENNIAGVNKSLTKSRIKHIQNVKNAQYKTLISHGFNELEPFHKELNKEDPKYVLKDVHYLWWEEIN